MVEGGQQFLLGAELKIQVLWMGWQEASGACHAINGLRNEIEFCCDFCGAYHTAQNCVLAKTVTKRGAEWGGGDRVFRVTLLMDGTLRPSHVC